MGGLVEVRRWLVRVDVSGQGLVWRRRDGFQL